MLNIKPDIGSLETFITLNEPADYKTWTNEGNA